MYFYIAGTHGTQLTLLRFVEKKQLNAEMYFYLGGTHGTQLTLLRFVVKRQIK
jgi:hypothetical protein